MTTQETQRIGAKVAAIRKANGLSQRALAEQAKVSQSQVVNIERAIYSPSLDTLAKVLDPLGYRLAIIPKETTQIG